MLINQIISACMAFGVLLGGIDAVLGNRFGFGSRFEQGFRLLGPIALSMAGIICMTPTLSTILEVTLVPVLKLIHMDPGIFGGLLAIDMGGYSLAAELALDARMRDFSGIILAATFGCTLVFVIPVGLGTIRTDDQPHFTKGILLGFLCGHPKISPEDDPAVSPVCCRHPDPCHGGPYPCCLHPHFRHRADQEYAAPDGCHEDRQRHLHRHAGQYASGGAAAAATSDAL